MLTLALSLLAASATPVVVDIPEPTPSRMSKAEIRAHNAKLDRQHPYYIRCVKTPDTGSLVARKPVCRTNAQWAAFDAAGQEAARDMGNDAVARSASSSSN